MFIFTACFIVFILSGIGVFHTRAGKSVEAKNAVKAIEGQKNSFQVKKRAEQFTFIGWQVVKAFEELPESMRPSIDIVAAVKALDFKYNSDSVNHHFPYEIVKNINGSVHCQCVTGRNSNGNNRYYSDDYNLPDSEFRKNKRHQECQKFEGSYTTLLSEMSHIRREITLQERALKDQERAVLLAGMKGDLDSVKSITEHFRNERAIISDTTSEIRSQTRSLSE